MRFSTLTLALACWVAPGAETFAEAPVTTALPRYALEQSVTGELSSMGDGSFGPLMDSWFEAFHARQPGIRRGRWDHGSAATAIGALMFELADMAPIGRELAPAELAPYAHQFHGDMMRSPLMLHVASRDDRPLFIGVNKRPGAPLPQRVKEFLSFVLSDEGQHVVAATEGYSPLTPAEAIGPRGQLDGFLADLDAGLPSFRATPGVSGRVRSVGSDGMKSLMDRWMRDLSRNSPGIAPGSRWEHLGTLNGFHALLLGETDIAPMGRELWPSEISAYREVHGNTAPFEVRVARGGFNTPQRTTAQAVFVHQDNPLMEITLAQLAAIFGNPRSITRWGQLGLKGEWSNRPVVPYMPPRVAPNATSMRLMVLAGRDWATDAREGSIAETAASIASDPGAIGFGGFEEGGPGIRPLAVARDEGGPYVNGSGPSVSSGRYPLTRYLYIRLHREAGADIPPPVKELLRYILSRDGQESILYSGYFPLTAAEVQEELSGLD